MTAIRSLPCLVLVLGLAGCGDADRQSPRPEAAPTGSPTVTWGAAEGEAGCVWHPRRHEVQATLRLTGTDLRPGPVTLTVTAHADEDTSQPVGSGRRTVHVEGEVDRVLRLVVPVTSAPYVDIDGVVACSLDVAR